MAILFERRVKVEVGGLSRTDAFVAGVTVEKLRTRFSVERQPDDTQPTCTVQVYNLARSNEERIYQRGGYLRLSAGYPETVALVFEGLIERVTRRRQDLARITEVEAGGAAHSAEVAGSISVRDYDGDQSIRQIVTDIVTGDMGLKVGPLDAIPAGAMVENFYWVLTSGAALNYLLKRVECTWFDDDGVIRINSPKAAQVDGALIDLNPDTGLVDAPIVTDEGAEARSLLNPAFKIGSRVNLRSETLTGRYKIIGLVHRGDNWEGTAFESHLDLREV